MQCDTSEAISRGVQARYSHLSDLSRAIDSIPKRGRSSFQQSPEVGPHIQRHSNSEYDRKTSLQDHVAIVA